MDRGRQVGRAFRSVARGARRAGPGKGPLLSQSGGEGDVRRKGAGLARFKWHSLSSELAVVWAEAGYISGEAGRRGAHGDSESSGREILGAPRSNAAQPLVPRRARPPAIPPRQRRLGPARPAATPQQIWIPRPESLRLPPPGGPRSRGRPRRARAPRRPRTPQPPTAPWQPPNPASSWASAPTTRR